MAHHACAVRPDQHLLARGGDAIPASRPSISPDSAARCPLDPRCVWRKRAGKRSQTRINVTTSSEEGLLARNDLAWAIAVGGIAIVLFAALLMLAWNFAATLFLIFAGVLLGAALTAMTDALGRLIRLPHPVRLGIV